MRGFDADDAYGDSQQASGSTKANFVVLALFGVELQFLPFRLSVDTAASVLLQARSGVLGEERLKDYSGAVPPRATAA